MIRKGLLYSLLPLAVVVGFGAWGYFVADPAAQFPVHWGPDGQPDRWGGRLEAFGLMPLVAIAMTALFAVLPLIDPRGQNLRKSGKMYLTAWVAALALMALIQAAMTLGALGYVDLSGDGFVRVLSGGLGVMFAVVGNVLGKARPNWFAGVRTPWTLSSDLAWEKTHRLMGRLWVATGLATLVAAAVAPPPLIFVLLMTGALGSAVIAVVYSWTVWRTAPDRR